MRFYVPPESIFPEKKSIQIRDKSEIHHILDVMRLKEGEVVDIFDGQNKEYSGVIKEANKRSIIIAIEKELCPKRISLYNITLYQALPKKSKMDFIVEKAVEIGADTIVPLVTKRTSFVVSEKIGKNIERWKRISKASAKQCGRTTLPVIENVIDFDKALSVSKKFDFIIFAALDKDARPLKEILRSNSSPKNIAVFIGPEGDFSPKEVLAAKAQDFKVCSLGKSVLRVETAAIYILSCFNYEYNA